MSLFDFFKRKELNEIEELKTLVERFSKYQDVLLSDVQALKTAEERLAQYQGIVDVDLKIEVRLNELKAMELQYQKRLAEEQKKVSELKTNYQSARKIYDSLLKQIEIFRENLELSEYGIYEPQFNYDSSEEYKDAISKAKEQQKEDVQNGAAMLGGESISWNNSLSQGQAMVKRQKKLMLRAFNGECSSFIFTVKWNNIDKIEMRIEKSFADINKVYEKQGIFITKRYKKLKLEELQLNYEYANKKQEEKEEQRTIREQMREEQRASREFEAVQKKAEKDEASYQKALDFARAQLAQRAESESFDLAKQQAMQAKIDKLEALVSESDEIKQRALSMAQQTKRGHVYVISNIGSFGEQVYKIGMTRRLDPLDRVIELGDASVPFKFDVHAMIYSENARALEAKLHKAFENNRVNLINNRKEFFYVNLADIEKVVTADYGTIEFTKLAEAMEYRESYALREQKYAEATKESAFPESI